MNELKVADQLERKIANNDRLLKKLSNLLIKRPFSPESQVLLMVGCRQLIENNTIKGDYPIIMLYCNWTLHVKIDQSEECGPIIYQITESLFIMTEHRSTLDGEISILKSLRFRDLITEFRQLFEHFELPSFFSEPEFQIAFLNNLITELLVKKPIMLNSGKIRSRNANSHKESYENILSRTKGSEIFSIESIYFTYFQNYGSLEDPDFSTYCAVCVNQDQNKIVIPIEFNSWQTVFSNKPEYDDVLKI